MPSPAQANALRHVRARAEVARTSARARIAGVLDRFGLGLPVSEDILRCVREHARVTLNFHPDRPLADGRAVIERLLHEGRYRSQFATGISNGSRTAFASGDRDRWEQALFGGAYHVEGTRADERPRYGGLDVMQHADGACPRFGSCYVVLRPHMTARCTFTWGDSHLGPEHVGTIDAFEPVLAALLEGVASTGEALGVTGLDVPSLTRLLTAPEHWAPQDPVHRPVRRALDAYIEAQVHSDIDLARDVEALVMDPAFEGTPTGAGLRALCSQHGLPLRRHPGFVLRTSEVPADFRGPRMAPLAARLDARFARVRGELDAVAIGRAAQSLHQDAAAWRDWGTVEDTLQHLKQLWHVLVRYGRPRAQ